MAGFGTFTAGTVGYIECDRNPYWHYATNLVGAAPKTGPLPYRQIIRLTGNSPEGAVAAVDAFLARHILTGAVAAKDAMPEAMSLWALDTAHFAAPDTAPAWCQPADGKDGEKALTFAGWQLADSMLYAGFQETAGLPALKIWRAKFLTEQGWDYPFTVAIDPAFPMTRSPLFEATLARRATGNELFIAQLASPAQATQAAATLETALSKRPQSHAPWTTVPINRVQWRRSKFGIHLAAIGDCVVITNFDDTHSALALGMVKP